jgi:hypothetical protein
MFNKPSISDYYTAVLKELEKSIQQSDSKFILENDTEDLVLHFLKSDHQLQPIEFDNSKKETMRHRKEMRTVPAHQRDHFYRYDGDKQFEYETLDITIPIKLNDSITTIKGLQPSTYSLSWSAKDVEWYPEHISFSLDIKGYGFKYEDDKIANEVASEKKRIQEWAEWVNKDIQQGMIMIQKDIIPFINNRKQKLKEDEGRMGSLSEKMGISLE